MSANILLIGPPRVREQPQVSTFQSTFASLGMSCQTSHQLRRLTNIDQHPGPSAPAGLFDWLICPLPSTISLIEHRIPDFCKADIQIKKGRPYWPRFNLYFWHSFVVGEPETRRVDINSTFQMELKRWQYLRERFESINPQQTVFVISNTQNNLETDVFDPSERHQFHFTGALLDDLKRSLARYFNTASSAIRLEIVTRTGRMSGPTESTSVTFLPIDKNEWKGSKQSWNSWWHHLEMK